MLSVQEKEALGSWGGSEEERKARKKYRDKKYRDKRDFLNPLK